MTRLSFPGTIEPLESRIAPARIIDLNLPDQPGDIRTDYDHATLFIATGGVPTDSIAQAVGGTADTYLLKLSAGDVVRVYNDSTGLEDFLKITTGNVVAFFVDKNQNLKAESNELVSLSLGKDVSLTLKGGLEGDIATNLNENGSKDFADFSLDVTSLVSTTQGIKGLNISGGSVGGNILAGGNITGITIAGSVDGIYAGKAADGKTFSAFPGIVGAPIVFTLVDGVAGASISKISVNGVDEIMAGQGGAGAVGGSVSAIDLLADNDGFTISAGAGGVNNGTTKINGGLGGSISSVYVTGVADTSRDAIVFVAGAGGDATVAGTGGKGGSITNVFVSYGHSASRVFLSENLLADSVSLTAGAGGDGKTGGLGGGITKCGVVVATGDAGGNEIEARAGVGGANLGAGGKAGIGGSVAYSNLRNQDLDGDTEIVVAAGDAGATLISGVGSAGGSLTNLNLLGAEMTLTAGNGSGGKTGGAGGSIKTITVEQSGGVIGTAISFDAGFGGDGNAGNGGNGGSIDLITIVDGDFATLNFNSGTSNAMPTTTAGNGGIGIGGKGGLGGSLTRLSVFESDFGFNGGNNTAYVRAGNGGDGDKGGGNGGGISNSQFVAAGLGAVINTGDGGDVTGIGAGGLGGKLSTMQVVLDSDQALLSDVDGTVTSGSGGDGTAKGGAGGDIFQLSLSAAGNVSLLGGDGGNADVIKGAVGKGGSILSSSGYANEGAGMIAAGDSGTTGAKGALGGSVTGGSLAKFNGLFAATDVTVLGGAGALGGGGGAIKYVGYGSPSGAQADAPTGDILIQAGDGSTFGTLAGAGGLILSVYGSASAGDGKSTQILAGDVNFTAGATKSAAGGAISDVNIANGGVTALDADVANSYLVVEAGDAGGDASVVLTGAKGGDVNGLYVSNIGGTLFRSVGAGDGSSAINTGGLGGSVLSVRVTGTGVHGTGIGERTGVAFGYSNMGGIFAGLGGAATKAGKAGSVKSITASMIAAIVAGKSATPSAVESVSYITLTADDGLSATDPNHATEVHLLKESIDRHPLVDGGATFSGIFNSTYYSTASFVGSVVDITVAGANLFHFTENGMTAGFQIGDTPIDGIIIANYFNQKTVNFTPEAKYITTDATPFSEFDNK